MGAGSTQAPALYGKHWTSDLSENLNKILTEDQDSTGQASGIAGPITQTCAFILNDKASRVPHISPFNSYGREGPWVKSFLPETTLFIFVSVKRLLEVGWYVGGVRRAD
jgi:hypothetical protein